MLTSLQKENSRDAQEGLEGKGSGRSVGDPRYRCTSQVSNWENQRAQAPGPGHKDPGSQNSPASGDANARWRTKLSTRVSIKPNHNHALKIVS